MANTINWGKVYCESLTYETWGDEQYNTFSVLDEAAPECWSVATNPTTPFTADMISYFGGVLKADSTQFKADKTQL